MILNSLVRPVSRRQGVISNSNFQKSWRFMCRVILASNIWNSAEAENSPEPRGSEMAQRNSLWVQGSVLFPESKELVFSLAWSCVLRIWLAVLSSSFLILIPLSILPKSPFCFHQTGSAPIASGMETEAVCTVDEQRLLTTSTAFLSLSFVFFSFVLSLQLRNLRF